MSLHINDETIVFQNPKDKGRAGIQEDFKLSLSDVAIVGLKFSIFLDDDEYFIVLVDSSSKCYLLNSVHFDEVAFTKIQSLFNIQIDIAKYGADYYEKGKSVIVYPQVSIGKELFRKNSVFENTKLSIDSFLANKNPAMGHLSEDAKLIISRKVYHHQ